MFHEFGHGTAWDVREHEYPSLSGTSVPRDFVEFPSQFNEHWASYPAVFKHFAVNYKTGAPMPQELVARSRRRKVRPGIPGDGGAGGGAAGYAVAYAAGECAAGECG